MRTESPRRCVAAFLCGATLAVVAAANASNPLTITRIEIIGNRRIQRDTLLARIFSRPGDPYSPKRSGGISRLCGIRNSSKTFASKSRTIRDNPNGQIVVFYVTERPIIRRIEYKGNKSVTESDILDAFKDRRSDFRLRASSIPRKSSTPRW